MQRGRRVTAAVEVEAPAIVDGLPAEAYHADRTSISSSGLRALLNPGCPAQFKYDRDHPQAPKKEFDLGHAAHLYVLGEGPELEVIDFPDWRKKDAQIQRDEAYLAGKVPLLTKDHDMVQEMAAAIRQHPIAGPLFTPGRASPSSRSTGQTGRPASAAGSAPTGGVGRSPSTTRRSRMRRRTQSAAPSRTGRTTSRTPSTSTASKPPDSPPTAPASSSSSSRRSRPT
jgi:hypothetical protein